jgi:hypothetical protein
LDFFINQPRALIHGLKPFYFVFAEKIDNVRISVGPLTPLKFIIFTSCKCYGNVDFIFDFNGFIDPAETDFDDF